MCNNFFFVTRPEYLENVYSRATLVAQCFVYGDSFQSQLVAIVVPDEEVVTKWAASNQKSGNFAELCKSEELKKAIFEEMMKVGRDSKLNGLEYVKGIHLDHELWSADNGILTPTLKLKRNDCYQKY